MPSLLACDTTHGRCSVALIASTGKVVSCAEEPQVDRQAERLLVVIESVLSKGKSSYEEIEAVAVAIGPGSFTGIRIGLAASRGIGVALNRPVIGVSSFESVFWQYKQSYYKKKGYQERVVAVVLDARREQVYIQTFDHEGGVLDAPSILHYRDILKYLEPYKQVIIIGSAGLWCAGNMDFKAMNIQWLAEPILPEAVSVGHIGYLLYHKRLQANHPAIPLYIRPPDALLPSQK